MMSGRSSQYLQRGGKGRAVGILQEAIQAVPSGLEPRQGYYGANAGPEQAERTLGRVEASPAHNGEKRQKMEG